MATATQKKADNRKPNFQPNHLPATLGLRVLFEGNHMVTLNIKQGAKLSPSENITFHGGINRGWILPGTPEEALSKVSFEVIGGVEAAPMTTSKAGVHNDKNGRRIAVHSAFMDLPSSAKKGAEPLSYQGQCTVTHVGGAEYKVQYMGRKQGSGGGPQLTAEIGEVGDGFVLDEG